MEILVQDAIRRLISPQPTDQHREQPHKSVVSPALDPWVYHQSMPKSFPIKRALFSFCSSCELGKCK